MRADKFFAEKFGSRTKAKEALERGLILRNGQTLSPKTEIESEEGICFLAPGQSFVSNGGYKLARAISEFSFPVQGLVFADLGASTGGFTDCLLQNGAKRVFAVDVGTSQLDERLARDERVTVMDGTNARYLTADDFPLSLNGVVSDLSFISLRLVLPAVFRLLHSGEYAVLLFKPQFECEGRGLNKQGILPRRLHKPLLSAFYDECISRDLAPVGLVNAPVREKKNIEYVLLLQKEGTALSKREWMSRAAQLYEDKNI